jgi:hypothetical protein
VTHPESTSCCMVKHRRWVLVPLILCVVAIVAMLGASRANDRKVACHCSSWSSAPCCIPSPDLCDGLCYCDKDAFDLEREGFYYVCLPENKISGLDPGIMAPFIVVFIFVFIVVGILYCSLSGWWKCCCGCCPQGDHEIVASSSSNDPSPPKVASIPTSNSNQYIVTPVENDGCGEYGC